MPDIDDKNPNPEPRESYPPHPQDLEYLVSLLEIAALGITIDRSEFSAEELIAAVHEYEDPVVIQDDDLKIVLPYCTHLFSKLPNGMLALK